MTRYVGRLAPSPTGALHLGNVRTFMIAWLRARSQCGKVILRTEDLDHPKDKPGAAAQAIKDLRWLGFDWDEEYVQSERKAIYRAALESLKEGRETEDGRRESWVYPCVCSRRDVEAAQSAPHAGEQLYYPGTCRDRFKSWAAAFSFLNKHRDTYPPSEASCEAGAMRGETQREEGNALCLCDSVLKKVSRLPCWRLRVAENTIVSFDDAFAGHYEQDVSRTLGDFPLARDEFGAGYTLACTVDDLLMGVTEVVRGDDLLAATPAQILLARALSKGFKHRDTETRREGGNALCLCDSVLKYCHVPLVVGRDGKRLAKRHGDTRIATYRAQGKSPGEILGFLAASCGWAEGGESVSLFDLLPRFDLGTIPHEPFMV